MTDTLNLEVGSGPEPGTYAAVLVELVPFTFEDAGTGERKTLLRWTFKSEQFDDPDATVEGVSSTNTGARSKAFKWIAALLGKAPARHEAIGSWTRDPETGEWSGDSPLVARHAAIVVEAKDDGYAKVVDVVPLPKSR